MYATKEDALHGEAFTLVRALDGLIDQLRQAHWDACTPVFSPEDDDWWHRYDRLYLLWERARCRANRRKLLCYRDVPWYQDGMNLINADVKRLKLLKKDWSVFNVYLR